MSLHFSIKARVTAWQVCFFVLIAALVFGVSVYRSNYIIQRDLKENLGKMVLDTSRDVKIQNGVLIIDDDMVTYKDSMYFLVYQENNFIVTGNLPSGFNENAPFISEEIRRVTTSGKDYYLYDYLLPSDDGYGDVWIRGITSAELSDSAPAIAFMIKLFLILLPFLVLLSAAGGYFIAKRAFRPVSQIIRTVSDIERGTDLSRRIGIEQKEKSRDEIDCLAKTFDQMLRRLEASFEAEKQFSSNASHELRTPISVILSECEYALQEDMSPEGAKAVLAVIMAQSKKMSGLVSQLLTLARTDKAIQKLEFESLNISELVELTLLEQQHFADEKSILLESDITPNLYADVDQTMITRLFINLISNGITYGRDNGYVKVQLYRQGGQLIGKITDNGLGIPAEDLNKIWDRFYQVETDRSSDSMGLGLSMAKWIVAAHEGTISVDSILGEGSTFTVCLPVEKKKG